MVTFKKIKVYKINLHFSKLLSDFMLVFNHLKLQKSHSCALYRRAGGTGAGGGALCVEIGFTWTILRNQDATVKLKSELISIKF